MAAPRKTTPPRTVDPTADPEVQQAAAEHPESVISPENTGYTAADYVAPTTASGRPVSEGQLTPEQLRMRQLEDQLAQQEALKLSTREDVYDTAVAENDGDSVLIHILVDGFVACGRTWYRGQEIEFVKGGQAYEESKDRNGKSWLALATPEGEMEQARRYGQVMFRQGPWPGAPWSDDEAANAERRRNRAAPIMTAR